MVLHWRRCGRAGGCQNKKEERSCGSSRRDRKKNKKQQETEGGLAQLGEHLPCKQGVESSNLLVSIQAGKRGLREEVKKERGLIAQPVRAHA